VYCSISRESRPNKTISGHWVENLPLYKPNIEARYGKDEVAKARELSFMIVSSMRSDNPLRNIGYVVGILRYAR